MSDSLVLLFGLGGRITLFIKVKVTRWQAGCLSSAFTFHYGNQFSSFRMLSVMAVGHFSITQNWQYIFLLAKHLHLQKLLGLADGWSLVTVIGGWSLQGVAGGHNWVGVADGWGMKGVADRWGLEGVTDGWS